MGDELMIEATPELLDGWYGPATVDGHVEAVVVGRSGGLPRYRIGWRGC